MDAREAYRALHDPLSLAAQDGFKRVGEFASLGTALTEAAVRLARAVPEADAAALADYARELEGFDAATTALKAQLVARGLRLCADLRGRRTSVQPRATPARAPATGTVSLDSPLTSLRGIGPALAERCAERDLVTVEDLLYFMPLEYRDERTVVPLAEVPEGRRVTTRGVLRDVREKRSWGKRRVELSVAAEAGGEALLHGVWFRSYPGLAASFVPGRWVRLSGVARRYRDRLQMTHPDVEPADAEDLAGGVRPRYPQVAGVAPRRLERLCQAAVARFASEAMDGIPPSVATEQGLPPLADALRVLHAVGEPVDSEALGLLARGEHPAQLRLAFDELLSLHLVLGRRRTEWDTRRAPVCTLPPPALEKLRGCLPFALTGAQERVLEEVWRELGQSRPMHRLLQGDVGSGKTIVAFAAALAAMESGLQAAIMAPTEVLARQHYERLAPLCEALGHRAALLTASTPQGVKRSLLALADAGQVALLIGTHALLSPGVSLPNLALTVVDEQHRFGVLQRFALRERGDEGLLPHLLVMTATPIPRSLALTLYGELDVSVLDEKPPGRQPIETRLLWNPRIERGSEAATLLAADLAAGRQIYVVCSLVEASEELEVTDATSAATRLAELFPEARVGLVHGRLHAFERDRVLGAFAAGELDLLVATTVIEVGVDIARASVMVVEHAERFGLAQLHQLRGRVGRGGGASRCLLLAGIARRSTAADRLRVLTRTEDGFAIAEADLERRGPGELFGTRQAGLPRLRFADLTRHLRLLAEAQRAAARLLALDPELSLPEHQAVRELVRRRWDRRPLPGGEAG
ncbi:MAG: ATP-dependent DNA helicase RecG [Deltaproteobacteria bacterium]|nr:ATP-dependent DNA helicase RecG [Deltaproteobacteria bacterium]